MESMAETEQTINIKVLSPSAELEGGVTLADIPASTTVKELRSRIQNAVPSKPAPERMRLIYRGRVVANDADTLNTVFGADNIRESKDQSLHLVIRELPSNVPSPAPRPSTVPPNPFRSEALDGPAVNPLQTNPFRVLPQTRPTSQPQILQPQLPPHRLPEQVNPIPLPLPIPLHRPFAQAMAQGHQGDEQASNRTNQHSSQDTQAAGEDAHPPPPGTAPPPPMGLPNLPGNGDQPIRREGVTPNGARWSFTTYNQVNIPARILPQPVVPFPVPHAIAFGRPPLSSEDQRLLPRVQRIFLETKREIENIRMLLRLPSDSGSQAGGLLTSSLSSSLSIPAWRIERLRQHLNTVNQNLNVVDRALALLPTEPEVTALRRSATELRVDAAELSIMLDRQQGDAPDATPETAPGAPTTTPTAQNAYHERARDITQTVPADMPAELFLLSSPQGPVGVLFDQQGTYTTAPMAPTLPFQAFSSQFVHNRQLLADLGQRLAHGTNQLHNQLANMQPTPTGQPVAGGQAQDQNQAQNQAQNQNQNENRNGPQPEENDRINNIAGHLWLIFKLAIFVYVFAGSGGFYRPAMLGAVAGFVYLAQIGMFEDQFNFVRRHFEALLPEGAMAERAAQPNDQRPRGNISPEEAARRLLQRQQDERFGWIRDSFRGVERAFTLFVASLFPGVGERMVHAQEERERLERVAAEEERQRQEEEARKREEEAQAEAEARKQNDEKSGHAKVETDGEPGSSSSSKGKEKAEEAQTDISVSSS